MRLGLQHDVTAMVAEILGADLGETPKWLIRPGRVECRGRWQLVRQIYSSITDGVDLPETMPSREWRKLDAVLIVDGTRRILEVDEGQHFNRFRAATLGCYPDDVVVAFPMDSWLAASERKSKLEGVGFGKPRPPLFPENGGRHQQRAFRDALADILPAEYGWLPTLRVADFEVLTWIHHPDARGRMTKLLATRL